ncbi:hypothetical protein Q1695_008035 [Nippostrongylus brasiliensis]|nr:hypothetical protein Q1695_008035 [Nippostrongylus brasiliensis]
MVVKPSAFPCYCYSLRLVQYSTLISTSEEPTAFLGTTDEISTAVFTKPSAPMKEMPPQPAQGSSIRVRLLTKGYRQNLVDVALARVPRERLQHLGVEVPVKTVLDKNCAVQSFETSKAQGGPLQRQGSDKGRDKSCETLLPAFLQTSELLSTTTGQRSDGQTDVFARVSVASREVLH